MIQRTQTEQNGTQTPSFSKNHRQFVSLKKGIKEKKRVACQELGNFKNSPFVLHSFNEIVHFLMSRRAWEIATVDKKVTCHDMNASLQSLGIHR